jgi:DNA-binding transcriptional regulator YiaG
MNPAQCRAARGWLQWTQAELARRANVSEGTVRSFESGQKKPLPNNVAAMRRAVEEAGISLLFDQDGTGTGIVVAETHRR